ncbi:TPA_asm: hypothetical protein GBY29_18700, partial [Salmonella enterica subsp. diarizonae]|nr:hypothetical protein [Salmonella enterica subsp. diarizonae]HCM1917724.1 hypothetical protein [Salmonella enterica subsp. salamae serovar 28:r:e,n,z15]
MIYTATMLGDSTLNVTQVPDPSVVAGRWGLLPAGRFPECISLDTAMVGFMLVTPDTTGNPASGEDAYGIAWTLSTMGAGNDGQRCIPERAVDQEWITQILFMADGSLYERVRTNKMAFTKFVKRW